MPALHVVLLDVKTGSSYRVTFPGPVCTHPCRRTVYLLQEHTVYEVLYSNGMRFSLQHSDIVIIRCAGSKAVMGLTTLSGEQSPAVAQGQAGSSSSFSKNGLVMQVPKVWREQLKARGLRTGRSLLHSTVTAPDGTRKFLLQLADGRLVETVGIPADGSRLTVCVSSQVAFCYIEA